MTLSTRFSKFLLTSHVAFSVGWLGAVTVFLVLAVAGLNTTDPQLSRSAYLAMDLSVYYVILPFCVASLLTGIAQALLTKWGLFKHYWIIVKLSLTIGATILLLLHLKPIGQLTRIANETSFAYDPHIGLRIQVIAQAGAALLGLLAATTISIYKPWGKVQFSSGPDQVQGNTLSAKRSGRRLLWIGLFLLLLFIIIKHLLSGGMSHH